MTLAHKTLLSFAALLLAGAVSFPHEVAGFYRGGYPLDMQKRAALDLCQETNPSFVRFLASERADCYAEMKNAANIGAGSLS